MSNGKRGRNPRVSYAEVMACINAGERQAVVAEKFGLSQGRVSQIKKMMAAVAELQAPVVAETVMFEPVAPVITVAESVANG